MGGADGRRVEVVEDEVAVGHGVDRVRGRLREPEPVRVGLAVDLPVEAGQRAGSERHGIGRRAGGLESLRVALEHPEVGEQMVSQIHGLGALEVGVARHSPIGMGLREVQQARHQRRDQLPRTGRPVSHEQRQVGRDLVVARAAGVELASERADHLGEPALDRHVNVLVVVAEVELVRPRARRQPRRVPGGARRALTTRSRRPPRVPPHARAIPRCPRARAGDRSRSRR